MQVIRPSEVTPEAAAGPLFVGPVTRQSLVTAAMSANYTLGLINFAPGARNKFHRHSQDQVLIVTAGYGIVATEAEQVEVHPGDLIVIPGGEKHWHGATPASAFSHISLTAVGSTTETLE
ncbi:MAG: cupin domain-containing protein [Chloroflexi bacterium]|nr:cupin domain-containing protein [Chloroflexota bacterium]